MPKDEGDWAYEHFFTNEDKKIKMPPTKKKATKKKAKKKVGSWAPPHLVPAVPSPIRRPIPEPKMTGEWSAYEELIHITTSAQRAQKKFDALVADLRAEETKVALLESEVKRLRDSVLEHGDHTEKCEWIEANASGRILDTEGERKLCTCGWWELKNEILCTNNR
jgi:hypothetical protein